MAVAWRCLAQRRLLTHGPSNAMASVRCLDSRTRLLTYATSRSGAHGREVNVWAEEHWGCATVSAFHAQEQPDGDALTRAHAQFAASSSPSWTVALVGPPGTLDNVAQRVSGSAEARSCDVASARSHRAI